MRVQCVVSAVLLAALSGSVFATDSQIALNYNFNGMVHPGEANLPDSIGPSGYRSIADRGLIIDGTTAAPAAFGATPIVGVSGLPYSIVTAANTLDIVMLGNRNLNAAWDLTVDGDNRGLMPDWLPSDDLRVPQTTTLATPIVLDSYSQIGVLYHITNVGTSSSSFTVTLGFTDSTSVTLTINGRDWFGTRTVLAPGATSGLSSQQTLGNFRGADNGDSGTLPATPSTAVLNVWEAVIDARKMLLAGLGDVNGKSLSTITYTYPNPVPTGNRNYAIFATTVRTGVFAPNSTCETALPITAGTVASNNNRAISSPASPCGTNDDAGVWYSYDATTNHMLEARTCGSTIDTTLAVYDGCSGQLIGCSDNDCGTGGRLAWQGLPGHSYKIRVAGANRANGNFVLTLNDPLPTYQPIGLNYNFNGMVHGAAEQGVANHDSLTGYRSIADRGLFLSGATGNINFAPLADADGMPFSIVNEAGALDVVHLGNRNLVANAGRVYGSSAENGPQPTWQTSVDQTGPQVTDLASSRYVLTETSRLGVIYQVSDSGGRFDTVLHFTDGSSTTVTMRAPDWFNAQNPPAVLAGSGLIAQRTMGTFTATDQADLGHTPATVLNVAEAVTSVAQLNTDGFGNLAGKQISAISFENPVSNANYANSTPATGSGFAIIGATLRDITIAPPPCPADLGVQGGTPGTDGVLDNNDFVVFIDYFFLQNPLADKGVQGGLPGSDGQFDNNDFVVFIDQFFAGCGV